MLHTGTLTQIIWCGVFSAATFKGSEINLVCGTEDLHLSISVVAPNKTSLHIHRGNISS